jgi:hypothetical protein
LIRFRKDANDGFFDTAGTLFTEEFEECAAGIGAGLVDGVGVVVPAKRNELKDSADALESTRV